ncbi:hypothetical protein OG909_24650 [Streptomyces sp. NBC_01754]|nr:hypothetical protein [Streptomyces sp. NBC_01754]WSC95205.1 hypothetical protein OG909_24650 [Streptomyces sp. NBC_01754]
MTKTEPDQRSAGETAYQTWVGHTYDCATCRAGVACLTAIRLGREWREVR